MLTHLRVGIKSINSFETLVVAYLNVNKHSWRNMHWIVIMSSLHSSKYHIFTLSYSIFKDSYGRLPDSWDNFFKRYLSSLYHTPFLSSHIKTFYIAEIPFWKGPQHSKSNVCKENTTAGWSFRARQNDWEASFRGRGGKAAKQICCVWLQNNNNVQWPKTKHRANRKCSKLRWSIK